MGGCRCSFAKCTNSSYNSPETHFFHYPVKDKTRCIEWIKRGNNPSFLRLPAVKLKNKVVCDKHFSTNSFMNFKRDRLVHNALPINSLDSKATDKFQDVTNCSINFVEDDLKFVSSDFTLPQSDTDNTKLVVTDRGISGLTFTDSSTNDTCINTEVSTNISDMSLSPDMIDLVMDTMKLDEMIHTNKKIDLDNSETNMLDSDEINNANYDEVSLEIDRTKLDEVNQRKMDIKLEKYTPISIPHNKYINKYTKRTKEASNTIENTVIQETRKVYQEIKESNVNDLVVTQEKSSIELTNNKDNILKLRNKIKTMPPKRLLSRNVVHKKSSTVPAMTKEQLFQGIKKYLSTSMEVLLRMELFGSPDRIWKPDEIDLSMEFLNFGPDVYSYMTDELRWRLPSKLLVNKWKMDGQEDNDLDQ